MARPVKAVTKALAPAPCDVRPRGSVAAAGLVASEPKSKLARVGGHPPLRRPAQASAGDSAGHRKARKPAPPRSQCKF